MHNKWLMWAWNHKLPAPVISKSWVVAVWCQLACDGVTYNLLVDNLIIRRSGRDQGLMRIHQMLGKVWSREGQGQLSASSRASKITRRDTRSHRVRVMSRTSTMPMQTRRCYFNYNVNISFHIKIVQFAIITMFKLPHLPIGLKSKAIQSTRVKCLNVSAHYTCIRVIAIAGVWYCMFKCVNILRLLKN